MEINDLRNQKLLLLDCVTGSRAYGLHSPESDTDLKGVFILPKEIYFSFSYLPQLSNETNDLTYYEWGRFMELLSVNNPNILELLFTPPDCVLLKHPVLDHLQPDRILSRKCRETFGKYALSQIKKARGLNKKIVNPVAKARKTVLDFCYVTQDQGALPLQSFLEKNQLTQKNCGLAGIPHMPGLYGLYYGEKMGYKGIIQGEDSNDVSLSSIPKGEKRLGLLYFNKNGYSTYCRKYREYWDWVEKRNESRYQSTLAHGKHYDAKNMMHTFRLLHMAIEIAREGIIHVRRPDRDFLLQIKAGRFEYEKLVAMAEKTYAEMEIAFDSSTLPETPDMAYIHRITGEIRAFLYT